MDEHDDDQTDRAEMLDEAGFDDEPQWDLGDQFVHMFAEQGDLAGRTRSGIETRLRSGSLTSTITDLFGVGIATVAELLGKPERTNASAPSQRRF